MTLAGYAQPEHICQALPIEVILYVDLFQEEHGAMATDAELMAFSEEHLYYEIWMLLGLRKMIFGSTSKPHTEEDQIRINAITECFALHVRVLIDFLYGEDRKKPDDICAVDFFQWPDDWTSIRPSQPSVLADAKVRANKELVHLTSQRIGGTDSSKEWNSNLVDEIKDILKLFAAHAVCNRLSNKVVKLIQQPPTTWVSTIPGRPSNITSSF